MLDAYILYYYISKDLKIYIFFICHGNMQDKSICPLIFYPNTLRLRRFKSLFDRRK